MKSMRRAARSRSAGYRLDTLRELVIVPIIYLGPPLLCTAPLLLLYWLYRPTVVPNPGLRSLQEPVAIALLLPPSQTESPDDAGTPNQVALADVAGDFHQPEPADKKPKSPPATRSSRHSSRFAGGVGRPGTAYNPGATVANPGWYTGMSGGAASAYASAVAQSGRYRW
jgi:hypothetical protein